MWKCSAASTKSRLQSRQGMVLSNRWRLHRLVTEGCLVEKPVPEEPPAAPSRGQPSREEDPSRLHRESPCGRSKVVRHAGWRSRPNRATSIGVEGARGLARLRLANLVHVHNFNRGPSACVLRQREKAFYYDAREAHYIRFGPRAWFDPDMRGRNSHHF